MADDFLNKAISQELSKKKGFKIEAFIEKKDEQSLSVALKSFKDGNILQVSQNFHGFKLVNAIESAFETLERHISNFELLPDNNNNNERLADFLKTQMYLKSQFDKNFQFLSLDEAERDHIAQVILSNSSRKEDALAYFNEHYYRFIDEICS